MKKGIKHRGNGQGCAIKVAGGKWKAIATIGYIDGKVVRRTKSGFLTKSDALAYIPSLKESIKQNRSDQTLYEVFENMMASHTVSKSTENCYKAGFALFRPLFGQRLSDLTIDDYQEIIDETEAGIKTQKNAKTALGLVYKWAIPRGGVPDKLNVAAFLKLGRAEKSNKRGFTTEELRLIKESIGKIPFADLVYCDCYLGFRPSAFLALKASNYNSDNRAFVGGIKTEAGIDRTVTVSPKIQRIVNEKLKASGDGYVFGSNGKKIPLKTYRRGFYRLLDSLNIENSRHDLTPHSCRHTFATLMKRINAPEKDKLELMGHTASEMLRSYQDVNYEDLRRITDAL